MSSEFEDLLHKALEEKGFTMVSLAVDPNVTAKVDLRVSVSIEGSATSLVDATYEALTLHGIEDIEKRFGKTLVLLGCDCVTVEEKPYGQPPAYVYHGCIFAQGERAPLAIQTTYLALQGIYSDLPPFSKLTSDQKKTITTHVEMLADYLRK